MKPYVFIVLLLPLSVSAQDKDWTKKSRSDKYPDAQYMQAVGSGATADEAKSQAFIKIAQSIEVKIRGEQTFSSTEKISGKSGETASSMTENTRAQVDLQLQGLRVADTDYSKKNKTHYALAVLDRKVAGDALKAEIADRDKRFRSFLQEGEKAFEEKRYYAALEKFQTSVSDLLGIDKRLKKMRIIQPDERFESAIAKISEESKISTFVDRIGRDVESGNLDIACAILMYRLQRALSESDLRIVFGQFTYQDTRMSSAFASYFRGKVEVELGKGHGLNIVKESVLADQLKSKGGEYAGTVESLAQITGSDAAVVGSYWELDDQVEVRLQAVSQLTGQAIGSANFSFPSKWVPKSISMRPDNYSSAQHDLEILKDSRESQLKIVVWTDRGESAVYREGEKMKVFLKATETCYVQVVYRDAGGNHIQIYPNDLSEEHARIEGGRVFELGGKDTPFEFVIGPPFGTELIKVFASSKPLTKVPNRQAVGNGMYAINLSAADLIAAMRQHAVDGKYGEASVTLTSVKAP